MFNRNIIRLTPTLVSLFFLAAPVFADDKDEHNPTSIVGKNLLGKDKTISTAPGGVIDLNNSFF